MPTNFTAVDHDTILIAELEGLKCAMLFARDAGIRCIKVCTCSNIFISILNRDNRNINFNQSNFHTHVMTLILEINEIQMFFDIEVEFCFSHINDLQELIDNSLYLKERYFNLKS